MDTLLVTGRLCSVIGSVDTCRITAIDRQEKTVFVESPVGVVPLAPWQITSSREAAESREVGAGKGESQLRFMDTEGLEL